jgi:hypothetical protein
MNKGTRCRAVPHFSRSFENGNAEISGNLLSLTVVYTTPALSAIWYFGLNPLFNKYKNTKKISWSPRETFRVPFRVWGDARWRFSGSDNKQNEREERVALQMGFSRRCSNGERRHRRCRRATLAPAINGNPKILQTLPLRPWWNRRRAPSHGANLGARAGRSRPVAAGWLTSVRIFYPSRYPRACSRLRIPTSSLHAAAALLLLPVCCRWRELRSTRSRSRSRAGFFSRWVSKEARTCSSGLPIFVLCVQRLDFVLAFRSCAAFWPLKSGAFFLPLWCVWLICLGPVPSLHCPRHCWLLPRTVLCSYVFRGVVSVERYGRTIHCLFPPRAVANPYEYTWWWK